MNTLSLLFWEKDLLKTFIPSIPGLTEMLGKHLELGLRQGIHS